MRVLGFMTGTSVDAVDAAVIDTDGVVIQRLGPCGEVKLSRATREAVERATADALATDSLDPPPASFALARRRITRAHVEAAAGIFGAVEGLCDLIGVHGQTILHRPPRGRDRGLTIQLIDAQAIADAFGVPVVHDLRKADVALGGEGAPLAPAYHKALCRMSGLAEPAAVLNLGGVGNLTLVGPADRLLAFDTGPANGMMDLIVQRRTGERMDRDGLLARAGNPHRPTLELYLSDPFFSRSGAKSLDRFDLPLAPLERLSLEDAVATAVELAAVSIARAVGSTGLRPSQIVATGGGRRNPALMRSIAAKIGVPLLTAEEVGWRGDSVEAEAFAYLAARHVHGLPTSFPETTGVPYPLVGGAIARPRAGMRPGRPAAARPASGSRCSGTCT